MRILFWNTYRNKNINTVLSELIIENNISFVVLAEYSAQMNELIAILSTHGIVMKQYNSLCNRVKLLGSIACVEPSLDDSHHTIQIINKKDIFECFLYTPEYDKYKYRMFFVKHDIANYPVEIILDESISESISDSNSGYIHTCNTRDELEVLIYSIFNSKRIVTVMQELIRINQAKKSERDRNNTNGWN